MGNKQPMRIRTISEYHQVMGLPKPQHPLISVIDISIINYPVDQMPLTLFFDFYSISMKRDFNAKMKYGQQSYDFDEGIMFFISPGQIFGIESDAGRPLNRSGWLLLIHPDFLHHTPLAKTMRQYEFFDYSVNQALFLSDKEELIITGMMKNIQQEYHTNIDKHTQPVMIAHIELLLTYAQRFYERQFITRKVSNHQVLARLEALLNTYFNSDDMMQKGIPTVMWVAEQLNITSSYLSALLKVHTGLSTQQHIHQKLIDIAKEKLSTTDLTVSEIAYELGFEHPQSFSKLFKAKTSQSPLQFKASFN